ncbi:MAG: Lrp/AsnC family transcriptional regulator [Thaumarchaeota archaeon]|nr:MAG: Lrp/AsnC family transcriptional regulator [Nitrososphaerota archaeon]
MQLFLKLDAIDISILDAFLNDGRASLRDVARETSLSTPTVSSHLSRLMKGRLIKKFVPLLNLDAIDQGIVSVVTLKVPPSEVNTLAKRRVYASWNISCPRQSRTAVA